MEEIKLTQYKAKDGTVFGDKEQCLKYEKDCEEKNKMAYLIQYAKEIKIYCEGNETCNNCPFALTYGCALGYQPTNWEI